jgi:hypothetical protein
MAVADYHYVGTRQGMITLYKEMQVAKCNIPTITAVDELPALIQEGGDSAEPECRILAIAQPDFFIKDKHQSTMPGLIIDIAEELNFTLQMFDVRLQFFNQRRTRLIEVVPAPKH